MRGERAWMQGWVQAWIAWIQERIAAQGRALLTYLGFSAAIVVLLVMRQISTMLGRVETGRLGTGMSVLTGWHVGPAAIDEAGLLWSTADARGHAASLIRWHVLADMFFVLLLALGLRLLLSRTVRRPQPPTPGVAADPRGYLPRWALPMVLLYAASDVVENFLTLAFADRVSAGEPPSTGLDIGLMIATWVKWASLVVILVSALRHSLLNLMAREQKQSVPAAIRSAQRSRRAADPRGARVWRRHRVQVGAVVVLALLVAVPAGGPLDQLPDILRTYADDDGIRVGEIVSSVVTLALLCLALEVAGRWALLDRSPPAGGAAQPDRSLARTPRFLLGLSCVTAVAAAVVRWLWQPFDLEFSDGIFAVPAALLVLGVLGAVLGVPWTGSPLHEPVDEPLNLPGRPTRDRVRRAGRFLAALPVAIAGLGVARSFIDPLVGGPLTSTGESHWFFWLGVCGVLFAAPLFYLALAGAEHVLLDDPTTPDSGRSTAVHLMGAAVLLVSGGLAIGAAVAPLRVGPWLNATGSISVFLALVVVVGGWLQRRVELRMPYPVTRQLGFGRRTPVFVLAVAVFALAGVLNTQGGYHAVRLVDADRDPTAFTLDDHFDDWLAQASGCVLAQQDFAGVHSTVPLVLVAAPGGGIRAAYWTDQALDALEGDGDCAQRRVFAVSGVSGGSVGLVAHYAHSGDDESDQVVELSREAPLAASVAGMLYRDLPAGVLGLTDGWPDRAAVLEDAWQEVDPSLGSQHLLRDLAPGDGGADGDGATDNSDGDEKGDGWRPLLLLNGTEVSTGCRMVVSPVHMVASTADGAPPSCRDNAVAASGAIGGAVEFLGFRDDRECTADSTRGGDVRASTAALLSARFPYVSPSGELYLCADSDEDGDEEPIRTADLDGGAAENSGLASALNLWEMLEPQVAAHNAAVHGGRQDGPAVIVVPMLLLVDNHYESRTVAGPVPRQPELSAPLQVRHATKVLADQGVLEQQGLLAFSGPLPGLDGDAGPVRLFRVAPLTRPGVAAPLGWTLSDMTRADLDGQLGRALEEECTDDREPLAPRPVQCYADALGIELAQP